MYNVPPHVKSLVNRLVRKYEILVHQGHKMALQLFIDNHMYSGVETTQYFLRSVQYFRTLLGTQTDYLASKTEEEFRRKVYLKICEFCKPLSETAVLRINNSSICQGQLEDAIRLAKKIPTSYSDAKYLSWFISNACTQHWCDADQSIVHKEFKLVKSEKDFEALISSQIKNPAFEITQSGSVPCTQMRIALKKRNIEECYRKQSKIREYRNFWETAHNIETFSTDCAVFNLWNNISETGTYYVYFCEL